MIRTWEDKERERDLYPHTIIVATIVLLRNVGPLKYNKDTR